MQVDPEVYNELAHHVEAIQNLFRGLRPNDDRQIQEHDRTKTHQQMPPPPRPKRQFPARERFYTPMSELPERVAFETPASHVERAQTHAVEAVLVVSQDSSVASSSSGTTVGERMPQSTTARVEMGPPPRPVRKCTAKDLRDAPNVTERERFFTPMTELPVRSAKENSVAPSTPGTLVGDATPYIQRVRRDALKADQAGVHAEQDYDIDDLVTARSRSSSTKLESSASTATLDNRYSRELNDDSLGLIRTLSLSPGRTHSRLPIDPSPIMTGANVASASPSMSTAEPSVAIRSAVTRTLSHVQIQPRSDLFALYKDISDESPAPVAPTPATKFHPRKRYPGITFEHPLDREDGEGTPALVPRSPMRVACSECRARKIKCDRASNAETCASCVKRQVTCSILSPLRVAKKHVIPSTENNRLEPLASKTANANAYVEVKSDVLSHDRQCKSTKKGAVLVDRPGNATRKRNALSALDEMEKRELKKGRSVKEANEMLERKKSAGELDVILKNWAPSMLR